MCDSKVENWIECNRCHKWRKVSTDQVRVKYLPSEEGLCLRIAFQIEEVRGSGKEWYCEMNTLDESTCEIPCDANSKRPASQLSPTSTDR